MERRVFTLLVVGEDGGGHATHTPGIHMKSTVGDKKCYCVGQDSTHNIILTYIANSTLGNGYASLHTYGGNNDLSLMKDGGNVGIGTTSPGGKLHIHGGGLHIFSNVIQGGSDAEMASNAADANIFMDVNNHPSSSSKNGIIWKTKYQNNTSYTKTSAGIYFQPEGNYFRGGLAFYTNGTSDETTNASERLRIDMDGNVGIGTTSPYSKLSIGGLTDSDFANGKGLIACFEEASTGNYFYGIGVGGGSNLNTTAGLAFWGGSEGANPSNSNCHLIINRSGRVGI